MIEGWRRELADFLRFCASERRLTPMTCSAYDRDISACLGYLHGQRIAVRPANTLGELVAVMHRR